jgi:hypothetical protein
MTDTIKNLLDARYGLRPQRLHATVTAAPLVGGRSAGYVTATVGGQTGVRVNVDPDRRAPLSVGDTVTVEGTGTPAATEYWVAGRTAGARTDSDVYQFPDGGTAGGTTFQAGDILLGSTLADWSNWWYQYDYGRWQIRKGTTMTGAIGDLNGLYGYVASEYGTAFGQYSAGQVNITTDPTNGFRIRNYTTPLFQADTSGVVWALSTFRAGTGDDMVGMTATDATWRLYAGSATPAIAPFRVDKDGNVTATAATLGKWTVGANSIYTGTEDHSGYTGAAGDITLYSDGTDASIHAANFYIDTTGTIYAKAGYFGDAATRVIIEAAGLNVGNTGSIRGGRTAWDTGTGFWLGYANSAYRFAIGVPGGREMTFDGVNLLLNGALVTQLYQGSEPSIFGWQCTCVFSATDADTVAWTSGTFTLSDGTAYSINAGNTGNMTARNYIYLDKAVSTTALQKTTTASTAVGSGKVLIATAINSTTEALWQVFSGTGGVQIGGGQIEQRSITASEIATGTLTANEIAANTITASQIAAATITTTQIAANTIVAGNIASSTITGAKIAGNTITASQIAAATITTTQIAANTIVAGNIASSTITGAKIAGNTITAGLLAVTAGGANLLLNSSLQVDANADNIADNWDAYNSGNEVLTGTTVLTTGGVDNRGFMRITWAVPNTSTKGIRGWNTWGGVQGGWLANTTYIVSFWAKSPDLSGAAQMTLYWATSPATQTDISNPVITTAWQRYIFRITWGASVQAYGALYISIVYGTAVYGSLDFDHVQVEQADTPSAWKPYPSELEPGSVTADKISVTSLAAIEVDTGALNMSGFLTIGSSGGIFQGTYQTGHDGDAAYPETGLKIWNDSGVGRIAGYNTHVLQWYAGTDGKLYAGGGNVIIDATGIQAGSVYLDNSGVKLDLGGTFKEIYWSSSGAPKARVYGASDALYFDLSDADGTPKVVVTGAYLDVSGVYKVDNVQVVGNRVVDARCDDTVNTSTWNSTTAGVLDALRDAMITHGLIAAA